MAPYSSLSDLTQQLLKDALEEYLYPSRQEFEAALAAACQHFQLDPIDMDARPNLSQAQCIVLSAALGLGTKQHADLMQNITVLQNHQIRDDGKNVERTIAIEFLERTIAEQAAAASKGGTKKKKAKTAVLDPEAALARAAAKVEAKAEKVKVTLAKNFASRPGESLYARDHYNVERRIADQAKALAKAEGELSDPDITKADREAAIAHLFYRLKRAFLPTANREEAWNKRLGTIIPFADAQAWDASFGDDDALAIDALERNAYTVAKAIVIDPALTEKVEKLFAIGRRIPLPVLPPTIPLPMVHFPPVKEPPKPIPLTVLPKTIPLPMVHFPIDGVQKACGERIRTAAQQLAALAPYDKTQAERIAAGLFMALMDIAYEGEQRDTLRKTLTRVLPYEQYTAWRGNPPSDAVILDYLGDEGRAGVLSHLLIRDEALQSTAAKTLLALPGALEYGDMRKIDTQWSEPQQLAILQMAREHGVPARSLVDFCARLEGRSLDYFTDVNSLNTAHVDQLGATGADALSINALNAIAMSLGFMSPAAKMQFARLAGYVPPPMKRIPLTVLPMTHLPPTVEVEDEIEEAPVAKPKRKRPQRTIDATPKPPIDAITPAVAADETLEVKRDPQPARVKKLTELPPYTHDQAEPMLAKARAAFTAMATADGGTHRYDIQEAEAIALALFHDLTDAQVSHEQLSLKTKGVDETGKPVGISHSALGRWRHPDPGKRAAVDMDLVATFSGVMTRNLIADAAQAVEADRYLRALPHLENKDAAQLAAEGVGADEIRFIEARQKREPRPAKEKPGKERPVKEIVPKPKVEKALPASRDIPAYTREQAEPIIAKARNAFAVMLEESEGEPGRYDRAEAEKIAVQLFHDLTDKHAKHDLLAQKTKGLDEAGNAVSIGATSLWKWRHTDDAKRRDVELDTVAPCAAVLAGNLIADKGLAREADRYLRGLPYMEDKTGPQLLAYAREQGLSMGDMIHLARRQARLRQGDYGKKLGLTTDQMIRLVADESTVQRGNTKMAEAARNFGITDAEDLITFNYLARGHTHITQESLQDFVVEHMGNMDRTEFLRDFFDQLRRLKGTKTLRELSQLICKNQLGPDADISMRSDILWKNILEISKADYSHHPLKGEFPEWVANLAFPGEPAQALRESLQSYLHDGKRFTPIPSYLSEAVVRKRAAEGVQVTAAG